MIAVFYDRKNKCEVHSDQLMSINLMSSYAAIDCEGEADGTPVSRLINPELYKTTDCIADIGYKSPNCSASSNWDFWCKLGDLVFLRLEERMNERSFK
jgi:hypothetical protein